MTTESINMSGRDALNEIVVDVANVTGVDPRLIRHPRRGQDRVTLARFMVYTLMRNHVSGFSLSEIGRLLGRHHGSVIHGIETLKNRASYDKKLKQRIKMLKAKGYAI